jgi:HlyD family secretion protein
VSALRIAGFLAIGGLVAYGVFNYALPYLNASHLLGAGGLLAPSSSVVALADGEVRLNGIVVAREVVISSKVPGRIEDLPFEEGSWVERDTVIARLDRREFESENRFDEAMVAQSTARLDQTAESMQLERERVKSQVAKASAQLEVAESERLRAEAESAQSRSELAQALRLSEAGILARADLERRQTAVAAAEALVRSLQDKCRAARAELELHRSSERQVSVAAAEVEQAKAQIDQAKAQLERSRVRLSESVIRAPVSGMIAVRVAAPGEIINAGSPILTIVNLDDIWARANVEESLVSRIAVGDPLKVTLASGIQLSGSIISVAPEADFATQRDVDRVKRDVRTFAIRVRLPNPERRVHPGMTAYVSLPAAKGSSSSVTVSEAR